MPSMLVIRPGKRSGSAIPSQLAHASLHTWLVPVAPKVTLASGAVSDYESSEGNTRIFSQSNAPNRPGYDTPGLNGHNTIHFTAANAHRLVSTLAASNWRFLHDGTGCTVVMGVEFGADTAAAFTLFSTLNATSANTGTAFRFDATNQRVTLINSNAGTNVVNVSSASSSVLRSTSHVLSYTFTGLAYVVRCDGVQILSGNATGAVATGDSTATLNLGSYGNGGNPMTGEHAIGVIYASALAGGALDNVEQYVADWIGKSI
jgi:hypothetical protein